jgi:hypothetical protein
VLDLILGIIWPRVTTPGIASLPAGVRVAPTNDRGRPVTVGRDAIRACLDDKTSSFVDQDGCGSAAAIQKACVAGTPAALVDLECTRRPPHRQKPGDLAIGFVAQHSPRTDAAEALLRRRSSRGYDR